MLRSDLAVTTSLRPEPALWTHARALANELNCVVVPRENYGVPKLWQQHPQIERFLIVQTGRLLLLHRSGAELFYHPNMAFLRLGNLLRGFPDFLLEAADLHPGDSVLDATLGYAAEAILCAHAVGDTGEVHGIEAAPELGILVREGLQSVVTHTLLLNVAMRRVQVVHLGHHLDFLRACPDNRYDVVCFDPFFEEVLHLSERSMQPLRDFGNTSPLLPEAIHEALRVARRRVVVKSPRRAEELTALGITEFFGSRSGKTGYGILNVVGSA